MKKAIVSTLLILLVSCEGDFSIEYEWLGMTAHNASNVSEYPQISLEDSIPKSIFCLYLNMETVELSRKGRYLDSETPPVNINPLDSLIITSNEDFDLVHPAGTNLAGFFEILNGNYFFTIPADGSEGFHIANNHAHNYEDSPNVEEIELLLIEGPNLNSTHTFTIIFMLEDGTSFYSTTDPIKLY